MRTEFCPPGQTALAAAHERLQAHRRPGTCLTYIYRHKHRTNAERADDDYASTTLNRGASATTFSVVGVERISPSSAPSPAVVFAVRVRTAT